MCFTTILCTDNTPYRTLKAVSMMREALMLCFCCVRLSMSVKAFLCCEKGHHPVSRHPN